jgi:hypothetical protein
MPITFEEPDVYEEVLKILEAAPLEDWVYSPRIAGDGGSTCFSRPQSYEIRVLNAANIYSIIKIVPHIFRCPTLYIDGFLYPQFKKYRKHLVKVLNSVKVYIWDADKRRKLETQVRKGAAQQEQIREMHSRICSIVKGKQHDGQ